MASASAVVVALQPTTLHVSRTDASLRIEDVALRLLPSSTLRGFDVFTGVATVVLPQGSSVGRATGVAVVNGGQATGDCMTTASVGNQPMDVACTFTLGFERFSSMDRFARGTQTWHRTYSDGRVVDFVVDAGSAPVIVPLPLGR
ncbi:MAG: hypothetical protein JOY80_02065 [Candidatus Dormibacteraeota bacterium]|nr:hypothetical protein [Candidatus Dormibacteraeota bacterium]